MSQVRGVTAELAERLAEVNDHLDYFAEALAQVAVTARTAQDAAREAGESSG